MLSQRLKPEYGKTPAFHQVTNPNYIFRKNKTDLKSVVVIALIFSLILIFKYSLEAETVSAAQRSFL